MNCQWIALLLLCSLVFADRVTYSHILEGRSQLAGAGGGGAILLAYGYNGTSLSDRIDIYNVSTGEWTSHFYGIPKTNSQAAYSDGFIAVGGGERFGGSYTNEVVTYNIADGILSINSLNAGRSGHAAAGAGQRILIGGGNAYSTRFDEVDIFFTNNQTWGLSHFPSGFRRNNLAAAAGGHKIFFAGGTNGTKADVVDIYDTSVDDWEPLQYLSVARYALAGAGTPTMVVFAGGSADSGVSSVMDIHNVTSGQWSISSLSQARYFLNGAATTAGGADLIFFGGGDVGATDSAVIDIYDPATGSYHIGRLQQAANNMVAANGGGYETMFAGGNGWLNNSLIIESSGTCRPRSAMAVNTGNKIFFLAGEGGGPNGTLSYSRVDAYNAINDEWSIFGVAQARRDAAVTCTSEYLFLGGGSTTGNGSELDAVDTYRLSDGQVGTETLSTPRSHLAAASVGGYPASAVVDIFNPTLSIQAATSLSAARYRLAAANVGTSLLFAGGRNASHALDVVDILEIYAAIWTQKSLSVARYDLGGASSGGFVFFAGGENGTHYFGRVDVFNIDGDTQTYMDLTTARSQLAVVAPLDGDFVAFGGGKNELGPLNTVELYNVSSGDWAVEYLSVASYSVAGGAVGTTLVMMAGKTAETAWSCTVDTFAVDISPQESSSSSQASDSSLSSTISSTTSDSSMVSPEHLRMIIAALVLVAMF